MCESFDYFIQEHRVYHLVFPGMGSNTIFEESFALFLVPDQAEDQESSERKSGSYVTNKDTQKPKNLITKGA